MKERLGCRVDPNIKNGFTEYVLKTYGYKRNKSGTELENAMKLYLTINGSLDYGNDPDVKAMIKSIREDLPCAHTQSSEPKLDEDEIIQLKEMLKADKKEETPAKKVNTDMDMFVQIFKEQYGNDNQISYKDISKLVMKTQGVLDKRSIHNRVEYLMASGCIETFAPNVFNIRGF